MNKTIEHILIATDFSASANKALSFGLAFASRLNAALDLVHVEVDHEPFKLSGATQLERNESFKQLIRTEHNKQLSELERTQRAPEIRTRLYNCHSAVTGLRFLANQMKTDLILIGSRGQSASKRAFDMRISDQKKGRFNLGSVAEGVIRTAPCPVMVLPENTDNTAFHALRRVVLPLRISEKERILFQIAQQLNEVFSWEVELLHVIEAMEIAPHYDDPYELVLDQRNIGEVVLDKMKKLVQGTEASKMSLDYVLLHGDPAEELTRYLHAKGDSLVLMQTSEISYPGANRFGGYIEQLISKTNQPMLFVPPA